MNQTPLPAACGVFLKVLGPGENLSDGAWFGKEDFFLPHNLHIFTREITESISVELSILEYSSYLAVERWHFLFRWEGASIINNLWEHPCMQWQNQKSILRK